MVHGSCAEALVAACFIAVVQKHWWLHGSWQLCRSTGCCMVHRSCAKALVAALFSAIVQKHWLLHGSWQCYQTCMEDQ